MSGTVARGLVTIGFRVPKGTSEFDIMETVRLALDANGWGRIREIMDESSLKLAREEFSLDDMRTFKPGRIRR